MRLNRLTGCEIILKSHNLLSRQVHSSRRRNTNEVIRAATLPVGSVLSEHPLQSLCMKAHADYYEHSAHQIYLGSGNLSIKVSPKSIFHHALCVPFQRMSLNKSFGASLEEHMNSGRPKGLSAVFLPKVFGRNSAERHFVIILHFGLSAVRPCFGRKVFFRQKDYLSAGVLG